MQYFCNLSLFSFDILTLYLRIITLIRKKKNVRSKCQTYNIVNNNTVDEYKIETYSDMLFVIYTYYIKAQKYITCQY